jgi:hypothetical protein
VRANPEVPHLHMQRFVVGAKQARGPTLVAGGQAKCLDDRASLGVSRRPIGNLPERSVRASGISSRDLGWFSDRFPKGFRSDDQAMALQHGLTDDVPQLAHVAGPRLLLE